MASNTVEATLRSKFEDGVTRAVEQTEKTLVNAFSSMKAGGATLSSGMEAAWHSVLGGLESYRDHLKQTAEHSDSEFTKMSLGAAAMSLLVIGAFLKMAKGVADFVLELAKESSAALEARVAFESLTGGMEKASALLKELKHATEGQVSGTVLMHNANRVLQSGIKLSNEQYTELVHNIFRYAKSAGVDAAQAQNVLTDAVIRGNARGFQALGLHISVRDAVSQMAEAMGQSTGHLHDESRMRAFYNELLEETRRGVHMLGPELITIEDLLIQAQGAWKGFYTAIGVAIDRSGVFEELLKRISKLLLDASAGNLTQVTLATNSFILSLLRGLATVAEVLGSFATVWNAIWGTVKLIVNGVGAVCNAAFALIASGIYHLFALLGRLPGAFGAAFRDLATYIGDFATLWTGVTKEFGKDFVHSFDGIDETRQKLTSFAAGARALAGQLEAYRTAVVAGAGGTREHAAAAGDAAEQQKKFNEQLAKYGELRAALMSRTGNEVGAALAALAQDFNKIDRELTLKGAEWDARRNALKIQALLAYDHKVQEIAEKHREHEQHLADEIDKIGDESLKHYIKAEAEKLAAIQISIHAALDGELEYQRIVAEGIKRREELRHQEAGKILSEVSAVQQAVELVEKHHASRGIRDSAMAQLPALIDNVKRKIRELEAMKTITPQQIEDLLKLYEAMDKLNKLNMSPLQKALGDLRKSLDDMAASTTQAFEQFWSDMVSGQENAGKKFIAALLDMVANELMIRALKQIAMAIESAAMLDFAGAARHTAAAAGITALAGILKGVASALSAPSHSGASASTVATSSSGSSSSSKVQVIDVGAPRGPQSPGEASAAKHDVTITLQPPPGWVANEIKREVRGNNRQLRLTIQNA